MQSEAISPLAKLLDSANDVIDKVWDPGCLKTVRELPCMPMYCSATNDDVVEMKNKRKDCNRAMECVSKAADKLKSLIGNIPGGDDLTEKIRKEVQKSCETVINNFEVLIKATSKAKSGGAQSQASFFTYFSFFVVSLGLVLRK